MLPGETAQLGPFSLELVHLTHSIPDSVGVALTCDLGTMLVTGDYKFDQTRRAAVRPTCRGWPGSAARGSCFWPATRRTQIRSEEHTPELQSSQYSVCRLLLEKIK